MTRVSGDPLENLELLAAACQLGQQIHYWKQEAWGTGPVTWAELKPGERQHYIDAAIAVLRIYQPGPEYGAHPPIVTGLRLVRGDNLIGGINLQAPGTRDARSPALEPLPSSVPNEGDSGASCIYCTDHAVDVDFDPYCSAICAIHAANEGA